MDLQPVYVRIIHFDSRVVIIKRLSATKGLLTIFVLHVVRAALKVSTCHSIFRGYLALSVRRARFIGVQWWKINTLVWPSPYPVRLPLGQALS